MTWQREPERLVFLSAEQYRERFGHDPDPADPSTERYPDYWHGWDQPGPPPSVIVVMGEHGGTGLWNRSPGRGALVLGSGALELAGMQLSGRLVSRLTAWNERFDAHGTSATWAAEEQAIAQDLQRELDARGLIVEVQYDGDHEPGPDER